MPAEKKVLLLMPHMIGGGAERVGALLMNGFAAKGYETEVLLTSDRAQDVIRCDLGEATALTLLPELLPEDGFRQKIRYGVLLKIFAQVCCNLFELFRLPVPALFARASLTVQYHREIAFLREKLTLKPDCAAIAFLQPAIPILMLAARGLPNKVIFSERGNAKRLMGKRYGRKFIETYYRRADAAVFQTENAKNIYPACIAEKGVVIPNPLKADLPAPYTGKRSERIVSFCRISREKNLPLLIGAFAQFRKTHPVYTLAVYGDAGNADGEAVKKEALALIETLGLQDAVSLLPFRPDVHEQVRRDAMYITSSDSEGLSNAMLEALAIGLPCICTDCPAGGAKATIRDGENGLLVPVRDQNALAEAMAKIADDPAFAASLSANAVTLRDTLSQESITARWAALL